jgi:hypothetical protein
MAQSVSFDSNVAKAVVDEDVELELALSEILRFAEEADNLTDPGAIRISNRVLSQQRQRQVPMTDESCQAEVEWSWL